MPKPASSDASVALEAAVPSPSGAFLVVNTSPYCTEDLLALVARVEACVPASHRVFGRVRPTTWVRHSSPFPQPLLLFRQQEARRRRTGHAWNHRWVVAFDIQNPTIVTLKHPDTLYVSELESLIAACEADEFVPRYALADLADLAGRLMSLYDSKPGCAVNLDGLGIRVERERCAMAA